MQHVVHKSPDETEAKFKLSQGEGHLLALIKKEEKETRGDNGS